MPGFNTVPGSSSGGGQPNMTFVGSVHMSTYNRSWNQGGTAGYYGVYSANQEAGYAYFVGATTTGVPLNRMTNVTHSFTRIDIGESYQYYYSGSLVHLSIADIDNDGSVEFIVSLKQPMQRA